VLCIIFFAGKAPEKKERTLALTKRRNSSYHGEPFPTGTKGYLIQHCPGTS
jgi:hypothetical protein